MQTAISRALRILNLERLKTERRRTLPFSGSSGRGMAAKADVDSIRPQADMLSAEPVKEEGGSVVASLAGERINRTLQLDSSRAKARLLIQ
jgi:hypothetical protein